MFNLKVCHEVFPFICKNRECNQNFFVEDFAQVALLWGFIYLVGKEYQIIGLTCPKCYKTSLRKYVSHLKDFSIDLLEKHTPEIDSAGNTFKIEFRNYVPFSKRILYQMFMNSRGPEPIFAEQPRLAPFSNANSIQQELFPDEYHGRESKNDVGGEKVFSIPENIKIIHDNYPTIITGEMPYGFSDGYLLHLNGIENSRPLVKVIPRIVSNFNIYLYSDVWLINAPQFRDEKIKEKIFMAFDDAIHFQNFSEFYPEPLDDFQLAQYEKATQKFLTEKWVLDDPNFVRKLSDFFSIYNMARNIKQYEVQFKLKLLVNFVLHGIADLPNMPISSLFYRNKRKPIIRPKKDYLPEPKSKPIETPSKLTEVAKPKIKRKTGRATKSAIDDMAYREKAFPALQEIKTVNAEMIKLKMDLLEKNTTAPKQNVLITGDTGVGKELFAAAVHEVSRKEKKYRSVNTAALTDTLLESELFGHEKGSFTGATKKKIGKFKEAEGGTIFLDEIGEISTRLQKILLRTIENHEIQPVGAEKSEKINDVKMVFATNTNLADERKKGTFREDLFYRIDSSHKIDIPPLRKRKEDISVLTPHFMHLANEEQPDPVDTLPDIGNDVLEILEAYDWPGNVRELKSDVEQVFFQWLGNRSKTISKKHIPAKILDKLGIQEPVNEERLSPEAKRIQKAYRALEEYKKCKGVTKKAAEELVVDRKTVLRQLENLPPEGKAELEAFKASIGKKNN
ncbi:sigma 54-interacting transcriptional regulator [Thermodesulfobacteriota bacterium]